MMCVSKYVLYTNNHRLKTCLNSKKKEPWGLVWYSNSDFTLHRRDQNPKGVSLYEVQKQTLSRAIKDVIFLSMAHNFTPSSHTKHVDIKYKFLDKDVEDGK
ncbi:LOW QUALITY PROTEIN: hypothetical protein ACHAXS_001656 [Conticribra weissflogii]